MNMSNLKRVADATRAGVTQLYYSPAENEVYTAPGTGRFYLTDLIRENTEEEIVATVKTIMSC